MILGILILNIFFLKIFSQDIERAILSEGQAFQFDCQLDESVYFARKFNEWKEIIENNDDYLYLNFQFHYLPKENILRVNVDSTQTKHVGFYACRKSSWTSTTMTSIYQLILAEVQSFYWTHICHGPIGSCQRLNDVNDENFSQFEVADQTDVEFYCCASVIGYTNVDINMNYLGTNRKTIDMKKKQELDGSWVLCASQYTRFQRTKQEILTCELMTDNRSYSILTSLIKIKDEVNRDPDMNYNLYEEGYEKDSFFNRQSSDIRARSRRRLSIGKKILIIISSILVGLILIFLIIFSIYCLIRKRKTSSRTKTIVSKQQYSPVQAPPRYINVAASANIETVYEEPIPIPAPRVIFRR